MQMLVLAELRFRAADQETLPVLTFEAATVAILAVMLSRVPAAAARATLDVESGWVGTVVLGACGVVLAMPLIWRAVIGNRNNARAVVWLSAYEQALAVRAGAPIESPDGGSTTTVVRTQPPTMSAEQVTESDTKRS